MIISNNIACFTTHMKKWAVWKIASQKIVLLAFFNILSEERKHLCSSYMKSNGVDLIHQNYKVIIKYYQSFLFIVRLGLKLFGFDFSCTIKHKIWTLLRFWHCLPLVGPIFGQESLVFCDGWEGQTQISISCSADLPQDLPYLEADNLSMPSNIFREHLRNC